MSPCVAHLAEILAVKHQLHRNQPPGCHCDSSDRLFLCYVSGSKASIFVRKALHIRLRDRIGGKPPSSRVSRSMSGGRQSAFLSCEHESGTLACRLRKLAGKDMRFSMKMMFAPDHEPPLKPVLNCHMSTNPDRIRAKGIC